MGKRDKIRYAIRPNDEALLSRASDSVEQYLVLGQFLGFLARDIRVHPERVQLMDGALVQRIQSLVGNIEVDLDVPLSAEDE